MEVSTKLLTRVFTHRVFTEIYRGHELRDFISYIHVYVHAYVGDVFAAGFGCGVLLLSLVSTIASLSVV